MLMSQFQKWYVSVRCLMWHVLCHVVFMHLSGDTMCISSLWMICIYAMFAGSGRVMLTDLTDLCDEEEVKSVLSAAG